MLLHRHNLSVAAGDLLFLDGKWYVTHSGCLAWLAVIDVVESVSIRCPSSVTLRPAAGYSGPLYIDRAPARA